MPDHIEVKGARVHNLRNIDASIPLGGIVAIAGVSGSGKSSLALGTLYAEGSRRYMEALSTYTRRRITQAAKADVDEILYIPAALALRQRPGVPGIRSTFGTGSELLNPIRLMFSRLASHRCPNGHWIEPTLDIAAGHSLTCPICGETFHAPSAEELSFNSTGACRRCGGTGIVRTVDRSTLVPDGSLTIEEGAVAPWNSLMWSLMVDVCREMGVRTNVPFRDLSEAEKEIVFDGPAEKKHIIYKAKSSNQAAELDFTYYSAVHTVENALSKVKDEQGMKRVEKFLREDVCPDCGGTRLSEEARYPKIMGMGLDEVSRMPLSKLCRWVEAVPSSLPEEMRPMAESIADSFRSTAGRLMDLGLAYLSMDRAAETLSTGERQRMQLARAVRNRTTGVLYVLDEPSIGLHPANIEGLKGVIGDLKADGNTVVMVDHDAAILSSADHMIEMGPGAGKDGGLIIAEGTIDEIRANPESRIAPFLSGHGVRVRRRCSSLELFASGAIEMHTKAIHTVHPLAARIPIGRLTTITGVSGSGKTTLILESLVPALEAALDGRGLPDHVESIDCGGIRRVDLIDATPIGTNIRSTVATYSGIHDDLRRLFAATPDAKARGRKAGAFSYNTGDLRCPECDGTGEISLDVQFLPDVTIDCPSCHGSRYGKEAEEIGWSPKGSAASYSISQLMRMTVDEALAVLDGCRTIREKLLVLKSLGLGYLTLGEDTPALSGGEAQRLKLASEMGRTQEGSIFVFDEPTIGLHPLDVEVLLSVFDRLVASGATVVVIEHDLDVMANSDFIIDMGPGGGAEGGRIIASGTPEMIASSPESITGRYLRDAL